MNKKVLITVLCVIVAVLLLIYWNTHSEDSYVKDMDAIEEIIELLPDDVVSMDEHLKSDVYEVKMITKEGKKFKKLCLRLIELGIEQNYLWPGRSYGISMPAGSGPRIAEIIAEMEQLLEDVHDCLEDFIDAAEGAGVGDYRLEKFIDYIF